MNTSERNEILNFFLNIFKLQSNLTGCPGTFEPVLNENGAAFTYNLKIQDKNRWVQRRMSLSPLGEESGSKSKCFKVIYDDVLVIKIPPTPITDFKKYLENIQAEKQISEQLMPDIVCIIPSVSAILKKIPPFASSCQTNGEDTEQKCIAKLDILPSYKEYLKIGKTFAFFMNLSTYEFLGNVIFDMHDIRALVQKEIISQADILGDPMAFENIYGHVHSSLYFRIDDIYAMYEDHLNQLFVQKNYSPVSKQDQKEWFLTFLANQTLDEKSSTTSDSFLYDVQQLLNVLMKSEASTIKEYKKVINGHIYQRKFKQNEASMKGLITNLLQMLAVLREKNVSMRDLKPDNVFVVGDLMKNPLLLMEPQKYSIGLIDFETSVLMPEDVKTRFKQPMLAGTPSYATPSHLFTNNVLAEVYPDIRRILHLQDWHAINSTLYNIITGKRLTQETGRLMPGIIRGIKTSSDKRLPKTNVYTAYNKIYWQNAAKEFTVRLKRKHKLLSSLSVELQEKTINMFLEEIKITSESIHRRMAHEVSQQSVFKTNKSRLGLLQASSDILNRCKTNWENGFNVPEMPGKVRQKIIQLLKNLTRMKKENERMQRVAKTLTKKSPSLSVYDILKLMFSIVINTMYKPEWGDFSTDIEDMEAVSWSEDPYESTLTTEATREIEQTITRAITSE